MFMQLLDGPPSRMHDIKLHTHQPITLMIVTVDDLLNNQTDQIYSPLKADSVRTLQSKLFLGTINQKPKGGNING